MTPLVEELLKAHTHFGRKEALKVAAVSSMKDIPRCVVPDPNSLLQPPVFHFGWVLDFEMCRRIVLQRRDSKVRLEDNAGHTHGSEDIADKDAAYWIEYLGGEENMSAEMPTCIRAFLNREMMKKLTSDLMKELGLWHLADDDFVQTVFAVTHGIPDRFIRLALSIGDNFHLDELPSEEVLAKIKTAFEFDTEAGWFMDALDTTWVQY